MKAETIMELQKRQANITHTATGVHTISFAGRQDR